MNRNGLLIALGIALVVGLIFGVFPGLDLWLSRPFYANIDQIGNVFASRINPTTMFLRQMSMWIVTLLVAPAVVALLLKFLLPRRPSLLPGRAVIFLTATLALGPGVVTNLVLKDHWGRSRPIDVVQLGGSERFVAWWDSHGECPDNCSFVSGDVSAAAWTLAPAALAPPLWRPVAYGAALTFTGVVALLRMAAGGHFFTDTVFAGVFTFLIIWLMHGLLYRWPQTRVSDAAVENRIGWLGAETAAAVQDLFGRLRQYFSKASTR